MKRSYLLLLVIMAVSSMALVQGQTYTYYGAHVTEQAPWINKIEVYNNGDLNTNFQITVWNGAGQVVIQEGYIAPANSSLVLVMTNFVGYVLGPDEVDLTPVEGTFVIETENQKLRPKVSYRYGDSLSLCEFFLQGTLAWEYVLPNTIQSHFSWTGIALMNPYDAPLAVMFTAYQDGVPQGQAEVDVPANTKYVRLSDGFWPGLNYDDFDQVKISSSAQAFPAPMSITGDDAQDRHVFFNGAVTATINPEFQAGDLYTVDSIVGNLRYVPAGTFTQGSPVEEPCRFADEAQFNHTLTRNIAVMETEVTRQMWADLDAAQNSLPDDPTNETSGSGMNNPAQNNTWYEAVLFANLLSVEQGLTRCYYTDASFTTPVAESNYQTDDVYCNFDADGYRLPTEGEWEYFCRAGTIGPFWVNEPNYSVSTCADPSCNAGTLPDLEDAAWFCANIHDPQGDNTSKPVGLKEANPWNLRDAHGNVWEWCWDWYAGAYPSGDAIDYSGTSSSPYRVYRGGYWNNCANICRSAYRCSYFPGIRYFNLGFRLVRTVPVD